MLIDPYNHAIRLEDLLADDHWVEHLQNVDSIAILSPEGQSYTDFGCYVYSERKLIDGYIRVNSESLSTYRKKLFSNILDSIADSLRRGTQQITIRNNYLSEFPHFFRWIDTREKPLKFECDADATSCYKGFTLYLTQKINNGTLSQNQAKRQQNAAKQSLAWGMEENQRFGMGVPILRYHPSNPVVPPEEFVVTENLALATCLFEQISDFLLDHGQYPLDLVLPDETVKVLPTTMWMMHSARASLRADMKSPNWCWDYNMGTLNSIEFIQAKYGYSKYVANRERNTAQRQLEAANSDPKSAHRMRLAYWACTAFQLIMLSITGADLESFRKFPTVKEMRSEPCARQGFRIFKNRASKDVVFEVEAAFLPSLEKYSRLREYMLGDLKCDLLFFRIYKNQAHIISNKFLQDYFLLAKHMITPKVPKVTARELRKYKMHWMLENEGVIIASDAAQNSIPVFEKHYSEPTKWQTVNEFTAFYSHIRNLTDAAIRAIESSPAGGCVVKQPVKLADLGTTLEPNCNTFWGCFFCEHYVLHADEEDLYKLKSLQYLLKQIEQSDSGISAELKLTLSTASEYIDRLTQHSPQLSEAGTKLDLKIESGYLHPFWDAQLNLLVALGKV
ncbi:hypothetical protein KJF94_00620 [Pseudomonas hormoni]|uniref:Integrase n=1 Tax=Pseudomonas hormoni TaxID=3093767 RepID=A0ABX8EXT8_9PSED|nr:hypothetical protein [Pseudomonas hormoni]QVW24120.1 hypothetical protein KJF94_00620 [Pseudomonas hormoni]